MTKREVKTFRIGDEAPCLVGTKIGEKLRQQLTHAIQSAGSKQTWRIEVTGQIVDYSFYGALLAPLLDTRQEWPQDVVIAICGNVEIDLPDLLMGLGWDRGDTLPNDQGLLQESVRDKGRQLPIVQEDQCEIRYLGVTDSSELQVLKFFESTRTADASAITSAMKWSSEETWRVLPGLEESRLIARCGMTGGEPQFIGIAGLLELTSVQGA